MLSAAGPWRVLPLEIATAGEQIDRTEALWREVAERRAPPTIRWYGYAPAALVLGVGQPASDVDRAATGAAGVAVVKRTSGGTTVLADRHLLALDVALPSDSSSGAGDVVESYRWLGRAFLAALHRLAPDHAAGIEIVAPPRARADQAAQRAAPPDSPEYRRALACFGVLSPYEVALAPRGAPARKLVGLSQIRKRGVVLYQAGLYSRFAGVSLACYLAVPAPGRAALGAELDRRIASLADVGLAATPAVIDAVNRAIERSAAPA